MTLKKHIGWGVVCLGLTLFFGGAGSAKLPQPVLTLPEVKVDLQSGLVIGDPALSLEQVAGRFNLWREGTVAQVNCLPGERLLFQLLLPAARPGAPAVRSPGPISVQLFAVGVARNPDAPEVAVPDVLIPVDSNGRAGIPLHDPALFPEQAKWRSYLLEIETAGTKPGDYPLHIRLPGDGSQPELELLVHCLDGREPAQLDFWLDLNEYGDKYLKFLKAEKRKLTLKDRLPWDRVAYRLAHRHRAILNLLPYRSQAGAPRKYFVPRMVNRDSLNPQLDWSEFDRRFGPYLDGSAFADGQPVRHFYLPFNPDWPAPFRLYQQNRTRYEAIWQAFARAFVNHFREKGWTQTIFQVYCNQKPGPNNQIPWHLDEPKGVKDYQALRYYGELTHRAFAGAEPVQVRFRVDISHFYCDEHRGSKKKDFRVNGGDRILFPVVDIWVISDHSLYGEEAARQAARLHRQGREVWVYGDTPPLQESGRLSAWKIYHAWLQGWNGFMAWKTFADRTDQSRGTNFLLYDLNMPPIRGIFSSLRFKLLWRALEDIRVAEALTTPPEKSRAVVTHLVGAAERGDWHTLWQFRITHQLPQSTRLNGAQ